MASINVKSIRVQGVSVSVEFDTTADIAQFFKSDRFRIEYDIDISAVPPSIAIIPFVCNVLPIIWLTDAELCLPCLDKSFLDSIPDFKQGYIDMYPMFDFKGCLRVADVVENKHEGTRSAAFFSGGLDAYATLVAHIDESPILLTLRGSDVSLDDVEGWENVSRPIKQAAREYHLDYHFVTTTFRTFIDEANLSQLVAVSKDGWWHGFQHGIGIIGHAAPLCHMEGVRILYIASSFTPADKGKYTCASDITIDSHVRFASTHVVHDQYEYSAQQKAQHVCEFVRRTGHKVYMHVCWQSKDGKNCCRCEKCYRRLMAIVAEGEDPNDYGFNMDAAAYKRMKRDMLVKLSLNKSIHWKKIQQRCIENKANIHIKGIDWIYTVDFDKFNNLPIKRFYRLLKKIQSRLRLRTRFKKLFIRR